MNLHQSLSAAKTEEEVKDAYVKAIGLKYAVDFVREGGHLKIWHLQVYPVFNVPYAGQAEPSELTWA